MTRALIVLLLLVPARAVAEAPAARTAMHDYFAGEQRGGYVLTGMGTAGLIGGGLLYWHGAPMARGASYALLGAGALHVAAGIYIYAASSRRIDDFDAQIDRDATAFVRAEQQRMAGVSTQLSVLKIAELVVATGGLTMAGIGWRTDRPRLTGTGLGLAGEMLATFAFDIFAARRAWLYRDRLAATMSVQSGHDQRVRLFAVSGRF